MQIPPLKMGSGQMPLIKGLADAERNTEPERALKIRVFLVIESRLLRNTLAHLLRRQGDVELSGTGGGSETNPKEVVKSNCDVVLLDFIDPMWMSVIDKLVRETERTIKIVAIGMDEESGPFLEAVRCGVSGYLLKDAAAADVVAAVRAASHGEASCPPQLCSVLFQAVAQLGRERVEKRLGGQCGLTLRQQRFMKLVAKGMTNKEIAEELHLSQFTVKNHMSRILRQLDAGNRGAAVRAVREHGYEMSA